jgi:N-methylhydantoinase B
VCEQAYPVRVSKYSIRGNSGGAGKFRGGNGIVREIELLTPMQVGILSDRRLRPPYGLHGGAAGKPGSNRLLRDGKSTKLEGKCAFSGEKGDVVRIESPGGGGWGKRNVKGRRP